MTGTDEPLTAPAPPAHPAAAHGVTPMQVAGLASIGAGAIHAAAIGIHSEHATLSRLFVAVAVAQIGLGIVTLVRGGRSAAALTAVANAGAVAAWTITRIWGISWIDGLEQPESAQFADVACAALGTLAAVAAAVAVARQRTAVGAVRLGAPGALVGSLTVVAMLLGANHAHSDDGRAHAGEAAVADDHAEVLAPGAAVEDAAHTDGDVAGAPAHDHAADAATATTVHDHGGDAAVPAHDDGDETAVADAPAAAAWPRPWDPADREIDFSGVPGVTADQQARAEGLVRRTLRDLPRFADVTTLAALGYQSIGDARTGYEHFINLAMIADDTILDPRAPESLVFRVDGEERTLVSAMFIVRSRPVDDPDLVDYGGPLMQWHVHENLCWALDEQGQPKVVGVTAADGSCPPESVNAGGDNPMVHVWITPHECGPFAALEGHGAGQAAPAGGQRTDQCAHDDGHAAGGDDHGGSDAGSSASLVYDPTKPIDLSGVEGVTLEQQAFAENLVARNVVDLPQWADPAVAEAAGYRSIGDAPTGHEHYIKWNTINDDVWLDPDAPESLVYEPQPDGTKKLVSAMYMLPDRMALADVPDWGGALMQWHIHDDLCFTADEEAPRVVGLVDAAGQCPPPLEKLPPSPMIHVWITPHPCGPFAALEGVGAGQVLPGEEHRCDQVHGTGG